MCIYIKTVYTYIQYMKHPVTWLSLEMSSPAILYQYFNALCTYQLPPLKVTIPHKPPSNLLLVYQETFHWRNARLQTSEMVHGNLVEGPWCWKLAIFFVPPKPRGPKWPSKWTVFLRGKGGCKWPWKEVDERITTWKSLDDVEHGFLFFLHSDPPYGLSEPPKKTG